MPETPGSGLDIAACRNLRPYSRAEYAGRLLWALAQPLFRFSPRPLFAWRRMLLRLFGAQVGARVHIYPSARIYLPWMLKVGDHASIGEWALVYNLGPVELGPRATVSHRAHLCAGTHDYTQPQLPLIRSSIHIGGQAWVCADAFVGPGVRVGTGAIVGAAAVAVRDVPDWTIVAGNPARPIKQRRLQGYADGASARAPEIT